MTDRSADIARMEAIVSLAKRRGFIFPSSEIYGGAGSVWDYGPVGVLLKNNVKAAWWRDLVMRRDDMEGLDAAILMHPRVWEASGHVAGFTDPLVDCKQCKRRFRADHLVDQAAEHDPDLAAELHHVAEEHTAAEHPDLLARLNRLIPRLRCPNCGGELTDARPFNMMFKTFMGPVESEAALTYLRPETAQGIFVNFKNVQVMARRKPPFGIAQIGKAFRNEITPGNFTFRTREFEQFEIEYFVPPAEAPKWFDYWVETRYQWYLSLGARKERLRLRPHEQDELAHYASACTDVEYAFPFGWSELEGIANRQDFDLRQHQQASGRDLTFFDEQTKEKYLPCVIEPSGGVDRATLMFLCDAYEEIEGGRGAAGAEKEYVLRFHPRLAPIKAAVLPLVRKAGMPEKAREIYDALKRHWFVFYDEGGTIGRRYRRQDEIGTPFCLTVDSQTFEDDTVTIRDRDSMDQVRVAVADLEPWLSEKIVE
jgi:glycyl-tRNA synthetase